METDRMNTYPNLQAFGSPMLGSTITTAPRRQGDGMDSESLLREAGGPNSQTRLPPRHINLKSTSGSTVVDFEKTKKGKYIPREPVKGAVKPVLPPTGEVIEKSSFISTDSTSYGVDLKVETLLQAQQMSEESSTSQLTLSTNNDASEEVRSVEGDVQSTEDASKLVDEVADLRNQLEVQSKVNADLKKLLVASMGDDLHHKVDSLIRTRAQLASEIGGYTEKIHEDYESMDKLAIQADMWRSKFTASRVLLDQLVTDRDIYSDKWTDSQRALQQFLQERQQMNDSLRQTYRYLKLMKDSFNPLEARRPPGTIPNILELARSNHLLADSIKFRLFPAMPVFPTALDCGIQDGPTPAEKLAHQLLSSEKEPAETSTTSVGNPHRHPATLLNKYDRFHPQVRYDNITFNCCCKCKGEIKVI